MKLNVMKKNTSMHKDIQRQQQHQKQQHRSAAAVFKAPLKYHVIRCIIIHTARQQFTEGSTWSSPKIQFETNRDAAYISTPAKTSVDLIKSHWQPSEDSKALLAKYVLPPGSVAETSQRETSEPLK